MTILNLQKDTPGSGEHSRYLQSMSEVFRKHFQTDFQKSYFSKTLFLLYEFGLFLPEKKKLFGKHMIFKNASENAF